MHADKCVWTLRAFPYEITVSQVKPGSHLDVDSRKVTQGLAAHDGFSLVYMES